MPFSAGVALNSEGIMPTRLGTNVLVCRFPCGSGRKDDGMDFKVFSTQLLQNKRRMEAAALNLADELELLEQSKVSAKTSAPGGSPISGTGANRYEDRLIKLICLCDELRDRRRNIETNLACIERGMQPLSDYERDLLNGFYVFGGKNAAERMMSKHHKERSTIYRDKDKALAHFTQALYGVDSVTVPRGRTEAAQPRQ